MAAAVSSSVATALVQGVADSSIAVGQFSADALLEMMRLPPSLPSSSSFSSSSSYASNTTLLLSLLHQHASTDPKTVQDSTLRLRYADIIAQAFSISDTSPSLHASLTSPTTGPAADLLFGLVEGDKVGSTEDVLIRFSALELLDGCVGTRNTAAYMLERGTVRPLVALATGREGGREGGEPHPILGGTALRVLGGLYQTLLQNDGVRGREGGREGGGEDEEIMLLLMSTVLRYSESRRESDRLAALQVLCGFARTSREGLRKVLEDPVLLESWLGMRGGSVEMKTAQIHSLAKVLEGGREGGREERGQAPPEETRRIQATERQPEVVGMEVEEGGREGGQGRVVSEETQAMSDLRKLLFSRLGELNGSPSTMGFVLQQLQALPMPSLRHAMYHLLVAVVGQEGGWGVRALFSTAGFREFLMSRTTETDKVGKEWKYSLVEALERETSGEGEGGREGGREGGVAVGMLGDEVMEELRAYLKLGPFYVGRQADVETAM